MSMGIVKIDTTPTLPTYVTCSMCGQEVSPSVATFGPVKANGQVAIICTAHLRGGRRYISILADFVFEEKRKGEALHRLENIIALSVL